MEHVFCVYCGGTAHCQHVMEYVKIVFAFRMILQIFLVVRALYIRKEGVHLYHVTETIRVITCYSVNCNCDTVISCLAWGISLFQSNVIADIQYIFFLLTVIQNGF